MTQFYKYNNCAGIYKIQNKINGKCYIGQSINLGKRLRRHTYQYVHSHFPCALYKAFRKYGIENFTFEVLYKIENPQLCIKSLLDRLEIAYIETYNSYNHGGYNQTRGGDYSAVGRKLSDSHKKAISDGIKKHIEKTGKLAIPIHKVVWIYDVDSGWKFLFLSRNHAARELKINRCSVYKMCNCLKTIKNRYIAADTEEQLINKINNLKTR